jgi:DNA-binding SARP family transcriptional activator
MSNCRLNVLGSFELLSPSAESISLPTRKAEVLLTRLALSAGQPHDRGMLAGFLWSDRGEEQAKNSLRQTLSSIKHAFSEQGPNPVTINRNDVVLKPNSVDVDVLDLELFMSADDPDSRIRAGYLFRGEFLEGIIVRDPVADDWLREERSRFRRVSVAALEQYVLHLISSGNYRQACDTGEKLVSLDPFNEAAWRLLMQAYFLGEDRNHALMAHKRCAKILQKELGITPSEETSALKSEMEDGKFSLSSGITPGDSEASPVQRVREYGKSRDSIEQKLYDDSERPSIVVTPFRNLAAQPDEDDFCAGLTEEIIDRLSKFRELIVIHTESAFEITRDNTNLSHVAADLSVGYVLKGSIRKNGNQLRIGVQLYENSSGKTIWSERMDRFLVDLFELEDEVASHIATTLASHVNLESLSRSRRKSAENMTAYDYVVRARQNASSYDQTLNLASRQLLQKAIELDPECAAAYAFLSWSYITEFDIGWSNRGYEPLDRAAAFARKAISLDEFDSNAQTGMGSAYLYLKKFELAEIHLNRALECNPNDENALCLKSWLLALTDRADEVTVCSTVAMRLNPLAPDQCLMAMITADYVSERYTEALDLMNKLKEPDEYAEALRAACHAQLDQAAEASQAADHAIALGGDHVRQYGTWVRSWPFKNPRHLEIVIQGLEKSGVLRE